jgi:hypothetical protein
MAISQMRKLSPKDVNEGAQAHTADEIRWSSWEVGAATTALNCLEMST